MNVIARAREILEREADDEVNAAAHDAIVKGHAAWRLDPENPGVVRLVKVTPGNRLSVLLVVYLDDEDFELDEELMEEYGS